MRPKVVITLFLGAALVLALAFLAKQQFSPAPKPASNSPTAPVVATAPEATLPPLPPLPPLPVVEAVPARTNPPPVAELSQEDREAMIGAEIMRINGILGQSDSNSEALLMSDMTNNEPEVRNQAVAAVKQTGDRDLVPALTNLAANTEDYELRHALLDAANFLELPTLSEVQLTMTPSATPLPRPVRRQHGSQAPNPQPGRQGNMQQAAPVDPYAPDPNAMPNY
jgi:hypothetical protein